MQLSTQQFEALTLSLPWQRLGEMATNQRLLASLRRQAAVDRANAHEYALVLMDIQMPLLDGVSATGVLRHTNYRGPIVALTAKVMQREVALCRLPGCTDVLVKPIDRARLYEVLACYVGEAQALQQSLAAAEPLAYEAKLRARRAGGAGRHRSGGPHGRPQARKRACCTR